jgi:hypothetical protein
MKYIFTAITGYVIGWTFFYHLMMEGDYKYFFEYLRLAWTGGLEKPTFLQFFATMTMFLTTFIVWLYSRLRSNKK